MNPPQTVLVVAVQDYLNRPLIALAKHLYGEETRVISMRAWRRIDKMFLLRLFFYELPFRIRRIFTPSDLGGRLVRILLDVARLLGVEVVVVPAHNHPWRREGPLPLWKRYVDLHALQVPGAFARDSKILINDLPMRQFFESLGYDRRRLVDVPDWVAAVYRRPAPVDFPLVFFTEVLEQIDADLCEAVVARLRGVLDGGLIEHLYVKLHPREPAGAAAWYRERLGTRATILEVADSIDVINRSAVVAACFSTVLLESLWLGKRVLLLDNPYYSKTMLRFYLAEDDFFVLGDDSDPACLGEFLQRSLDHARQS